MKILKAIYLPYLAFDSKESFTFNYDKITDKFYMASDDNIGYSVDFIIEDYVDWYIFETELVREQLNEETVIGMYGKVKRINTKTLRGYIDKTFKEQNKEVYKITLVVNQHGRQVLDEKCNREINIDKCIIERNEPLKIVYSDGMSFTHEKVERVEPLGEYSLIVYTTKKIWFINGEVI